MNEVRNTKLEDAMHARGLNPAGLAEAAGCDQKTVERWIRVGTTPYMRYQWPAAKALGVHHTFLWPPKKGRRDTDTDGCVIYVHRGLVPAELWTDLAEGPITDVRVLVYAGLPWLESYPTVIERMRQRAIEDGLRVRLLFGDPDSPNVIARGDEEGIDMAAKVRNALRLVEPLVGVPGIEIRLHGTPLYASLYMNDAWVLANHHKYGQPASRSPFLHVRRTPMSTSYDTYAEAFEKVWSGAREYR